MSVRFVNIDHDTPMLLPPDLRDWVNVLVDSGYYSENSTLRVETAEPVFGIIKQAIGFRRFLQRGTEKVGIEWTLMTTSYNLKRLFTLGMQIKRA